MLSNTLENNELVDCSSNEEGFISIASDGCQESQKDEDSTPKEKGGEVIKRKQHIDTLLKKNNASLNSGHGLNPFNIFYARQEQEALHDVRNENNTPFWVF